MSYLKEFKEVPSWHAKWTRRSTCPRVNGGVCAKWQGHKDSCSSEWKVRENAMSGLHARGLGETRRDDEWSLHARGLGEAR